MRRQKVPSEHPSVPQPRSGKGCRPVGQIDVDVLVVGAGPTGLAAACEAARHGLSVRIIDRNAHRSTFSKALVLHARTLEVFETMGVSGPILAEGTRFAALNAHAGRRRRHVRIDLLALPWGDTAYPYWLSIPQYAAERILETHLNKLGHEVAWRTAFAELHDRGDHVEARLHRPDGGDEVVRARWLIGCDGGRSRVREQAGMHLNRADAGATFILADVQTTARLPEDEGHVFLDPEGLLLIVPMPEPRRWRVIAHVPASPSISIDAAFLDELIRRRSGIEFGSHEVTWQSQFNLTHGLVDRYRRGRVFLAGDAAHVHSPVGGQGLNTGVQDVHNLLWKLAIARRTDGSADDLLDSYEAERRPVARAMVAATARVTRLLTARNSATRRLFGLVAPRVLGRPAIQARLGRGVGMLDIGYPDSPLVGPAAGAGRRLANPTLRTGGRLHQRLDPLGYTWVIQGCPDDVAPNPEDPGLAGLPLVFLPPGSFGEPAPDLARVVLVRPDRYVAAAGDTAEAVWSQVEQQLHLAPFLRPKV
ncbi:MAG TPA: FAD-dependent monooxygenase [Micromonosporaceae bacterium]|nr:FAD-dependent monooxygenase [Micromonosporaceae bacterium]